MRRILITWLAICGALFGAWQASANMMSPIVMFGKPRSVVNTMAIDGAVNGSASATSKILPGLTTTHSNDVIIVMFECNVNCGSVTVTSTHLTFTARAFSGNGGNALWEYCAIASSPLTAEAITVAGSGSTTYVEGRGRNCPRHRHLFVLRARKAASNYRCEARRCASAQGARLRQPNNASAMRPVVNRRSVAGMGVSVTDTSVEVPFRSPAT
jgi:hypothetical protein